MALDRGVVAIVGRPNVGKSTLFNRLAGGRITVVEETPGITRDRIYADCIYRGRPFSLIDTGGLQPGDEDAMLSLVRRQAEFAIEEADLVLFVVDGKEGISSLDYEVADLLRRTGKPTVLVANKIESEKRELEASDFYSLGMGEPVLVSSLHGIGIDDLLEAMLPHLPEFPEEEEEEGVIRVAMVGRPNVGKSSIINSILGEERVIVSEVPGTTRDAIDTPFEHNGQRLVLVDTAGIRRKSKVKESFDYYSVLRALGAIERSDVAVLVLDATQGAADQDKRISGYAHEEGRAQVMVANKWDLIPASEGRSSDKMAKADFQRHTREQFPFAGYAPFCTVSAKQKIGLDQMLDLVTNAAKAHSFEAPTGELNRLINDALARRPAYYKGKQLKIYYTTQVKTRPPTFLLFVNDPELAHFSTLRYLENEMRRQYALEGTPIKLVVRKSESKLKR